MPRDGENARTGKCRHGKWGEITVLLENGGKLQDCKMRKISEDWKMLENGGKVLDRKMQELEMQAWKMVEITRPEIGGIENHRTMENGGNIPVWHISFIFQCCDYPSFSSAEIFLHFPVPAFCMPAFSSLVLFLLFPVP